MRFSSRPVRLALYLSLGLLGLLAGLWLAWRLAAGGSPESAPSERAAGLAYLAPSRQPELWLDDLRGGQPRRLTDTGGRVYDFAVAPDGEHLAYSRFNELGGVSLWLVDRAGRSQALLECGADWCINPGYSPDGARLAYARRTAGAAAGSSPGLPRIWVMNLASGETQALTANPGISGSGPAFSPDGRRLVFYDDSSQGLRVFDLGTGNSTLLPSEAGMSGRWAPDGETLYYLKPALSESTGYEELYRYSIRSGDSGPALGTETDLLDYAPVSFAPGGEWLVVPAREVGGSPARQLWLMRIDGSERRQLTGDPLVNAGAAQWDPHGGRVAFQSLELGGSDRLPKVMVWSQGSGEFRTVAEDAALPQWVP